MSHFKLRRHFTAPSVTLSLALGLLMFDSLAANLRYLHWWPLRVVITLYLALAPGLLLLWLCGLKSFSRVTHGLYALGLSLLYVMFSGLAVNQLLPRLGVDRPLEFGPLLISFNVGLVVLLGLAAWRGQALVVDIALDWPRRSWLFVLAGSLLPLVMALGAFRLNNLASNSVSLAGLALLIMFGVSLIWQQSRLPTVVVAYGLFCIGVAVLLMTSLRGWEVTGHDIKREFQVYSLTAQLGRWNIALLRSAYNACLSITILPVSLSKLLDMSGLYVFKFLFQLLFGLAPPLVFYILKNQLPRLLALLGSLLFIAYPTFVNDSAMLTRQEIAFLFFGLQLLAWFDQDAAIQKIWRLLFLLFGLGLIVSHYSSAYFLVAVLGLGYVFYRLWFILGSARFIERKSLTAGMVLLITLGTTLWYAQLTFTATGLAATVSQSLRNIAHAFSDDNRSSDASASLFFATQKSQQQLFNKYAAQARAVQDRPANDLTFQLADPGTLPLTKFGRRWRQLGLGDPGHLLVGLRQSYARFLQLLAIGGTLALIYRIWRQQPHAPPESLVVLAAASLVLLLMMVVLPSISLDYGLLRAFQQTTFYLLIPIMISLHWLFKPLRRLSSLGLCGFVVLVMMLFCNLLGQLMGGIDAPLTLNNAGFIYGTFYIHATDVAGFKWASGNLPWQTSLAAVDFTNAALYQPLYPFQQSELTRPADFLYLTYPPTVQQKVFQYFNGEPLTTVFPAHYYTAGRDLIYSTTQTQIWTRPK